jgi:hypothetical protein
MVTHGDDYDPLPIDEQKRRAEEAELDIIAAGWVPDGYLEPMDEAAREAERIFGRIPTYRPPGPSDLSDPRD